MTKKVKLALLGCGDVAHRDYLPEFHRVAAHAEIVAVCGRGRERAQMTAERYGIPAVYTDYVKMLAETDADAVINLTPMQLHDETNLAVLRSGRHLYTEKPVASGLHHALRMKQEAEARGLTIVCAPCVMIWPQVALARQILESGEIGEVHSARGLGLGGVPPWAGFTSDPAPFFAAGGGPQRDMGVYPLHALTGLLGPVRRVTAMSTKAQPEGFVITDGPFAGKRVPVEEDDTWLMLLDHGNRVITSVEANNSVQGTRAAQLELFGLKGTIALDLIDGSAPVHVLSKGVWREVPVPHERASGPDHILGVRHLVECLRHGVRPVLSIAHAAHVVEIIDAAARASRSGAAQTLTTTF
ncbi:MAG: Gfo/Idh/MocA family oxidoreductase [Anaerolineae bacterium]|nr:Gfo/Idh/MocA family oxidoreductase [Candidatus Roseilinea sp.]MDW8451500.1 Gfo/Idh/MocA family oxidoreductase [Anaerolineae bacterium]